MRHLVAVALLAACDRAPARVMAKEPTRSMEAHTDLQRLRRYFDAPAAAQSARWIVLPRGMPSVAPGPTDTVLWALVALPESAWAELGALGPVESRALPPDVARALLPAGAPPSVSGPSYDISSRVLNPYEGDRAIRLHDALLLELTSR